MTSATKLAKAIVAVLKGEAVVVPLRHDHGAGYFSPVCYVGYEHLPDSYYLVDIEKVRMDK